MSEKLTRACLDGLKPYKPGKPVSEVKRELGLKTVSKMASNENPLGPSPRVMAAIKKATPELNRYPDAGAFYMRRALARRFRLKSENIVVGNGSDEVIIMALRAFLNRGEEVVIAEPTFLIYRIAAQLAEAKVKAVPLKAFRYDLPAMRAKITARTKLVFIANPDNPTGSYVNRIELENFLESLPKNVIVFMDEAYHEYVQARDYPDSLRYIRKGNVIVARTFSKVYALAGLRVGWAAAAPEIISSLNQVRDPFNVNSLAQVAAVEALEDRRHLLRSVQLARSGVSYLSSEFRKLNLFFVPSVTNFILVNVGTRGPAVYDSLLKSGIIVREMTAWGLPNFIRVTAGTNRENRAFITVLKRVLKEQALVKGRNK